MTHILVTGADGYVGRALVARLLAAPEAPSLTLLDLRFGPSDDATSRDRPRRIAGDLGDPAVLARATETAPDLVFHLAGITSRQAEDDVALGLHVNLTGTIALFERLRAQGRRPVVVVASSIGVYGPPLPAAIDDDTPPHPRLSYGAQKRMIEILLADFSRRGFLDGRAVRLSGIVARPAEAGGALSSFASDLIREPAQGRSYRCPIGADGTLWLLSRPACIDCLLQTAALDAERLPEARVWNLPALRASAEEIVRALGRHLGRDVSGLVEYQPQPDLQRQFAEWPPLSTAIADGLGLHHDGDLDRLIERALAP